MLGGTLRRQDRSALEGGWEKLVIVPIGRPNGEADGNAGRVGEETALGAALGSVGRVGPSGLATERRLGHRAIHRLPSPPEADDLIVLEESVAPKVLEDAGLAPLLEPIVGGGGGSVAPRESPPRHAGQEDEEDRLRDRSIRPPWAAAGGSEWMRGKERLDPYPESFRESKAGRDLGLDFGDALRCHSVVGSRLSIANQLHWKL